MDHEIFEQYLSLNCDNQFELEILEIESLFSINLTEDYKYILQKYCFNPNYGLHTFYIENEKLHGLRHYFTFGTFDLPKDVIKSTQILYNSENVLKLEMKEFISYDVSGYILISNLISRNADLYEGLLIDCNECATKGSLYLIDRNFNYEIVEGKPFKIKIANSFSHFFEIIASQEAHIPIQYRI